MIKKLSALLTLVAFLTVSNVSPAQAAWSLGGNACSGASGSAVCTDRNAGGGSGANPVTGTLQRAANVIAIIAGIAAVIIIMVAGISYMLSGGDSSKVAKSKDAILYALIGLVIIAFARTIIVFVVNKL